MIKRALVLVPCLLAVGFFAAPPVQAAGDNCKNVDITVINDRPVEIHVTKLEYYDYDANKWRSEALIDRKIDTGKHYKWTRDLEHVDNDRTTVRITYKDHEGGGRWGAARTDSLSTSKCKDNANLTIHADG